MVFVKMNSSDSILSKNSKIVECDDIIQTKQRSWSFDETSSLIEAYKLFADSFEYVRKPQQVWIIITKYMESQGFKHSWKSASTKWRYLLKSYYLIKQCKTKRKKGNLYFLYYNELDEILKDEPAPSSMFLKSNSSLTYFESGGPSPSKDTVQDPLIEVLEGKIDEPQRRSAVEPANNKWTDLEVESLVEAYEIFAPKFAETTGKFWAIVADYLQCQDVNYSVVEIERKWDSLVKAYHSVMGQQKMHWKSKRIQFYDRLDAIFNASCKELDLCSEAICRTQQWSVAETEALISAIEMYLKAFGRYPSPNEGVSHVDWTVISKYLKIQGVYSLIETIKAKWKNLMFTYKAVNQHMIKTGNSAARYIFFDRLHKILNDESSGTSKSLVNSLINIKNEKLVVQAQSCTEDIVKTSKSKLVVASPVIELSQLANRKTPDCVPGQSSSVNEEPIVNNLWSYTDIEALIDGCEIFCDVSGRREWPKIQEYLETIGIHQTRHSMQNKWQTLLQSHKLAADQLIRSGRYSKRFKFYDRINKIVNGADATTANEANVCIIDEGDLNEVYDKNYSHHKWTVAETEALIKTYGLFYNQLKNPAKKKQDVWNEIVHHLQTFGVDYSYANIRLKWRNLVRSFRMIKDYMKYSPRRPTRFPCFTIMNNMFGDDLSVNKEWPENVDMAPAPTVKQKIINYWSVEDSELLIDAFVIFSTQFDENKHKRVVWDKIADYMKQHGANFSSEMVQIKWKNMMETYRNVKDSMKPGKTSSRFPFMQKLDAIFAVGAAIKCDLFEETMPALPENVDVCEDIELKRTNVEDLLSNKRQRIEDDEMIDIGPVKVENVDDCV